MAVQSRRDQVVAYRFLLRRRHAALLSGDPDSAEAPLRKLSTATFTSIMAATLMAAGAGVLGVMSPGSDTSWRAKGVIIIEKESGSRFIYDPSFTPPVLHHLLNYTSARLLLAGSGWKTVSVSAKSLSGTPRGGDVGIVGAPDELPGPEGIAGTPWTVCSFPGSAAGDRSLTQVLIGGLGTALPSASALPSGQGLLVQTPAPDNAYWLVWNGHRLRVGDPSRPDDVPSKVLSVLAYDTNDAAHVSDAWLNTLPEWSALVAPEISSGPPNSLKAKGQPVASGQLVKVSASDGVADRWYVATPKGFVVVNTTQRLLLQTDPRNTNPLEATSGDIAGSPGASDTVSSGGGQWPASPPALVNGSSTGSPVACVSTSGGANMAVVSVAPLAAGQPSDVQGSPPDEQGRFVADTVSLAPGAVALVQAPPSGAAPGTVYLVSGNGFIVTKDALAGPDVATTLKALGYPSTVPVVLPAAYLDLVRDGPILSPAAAGLPVTPPQPAASPPPTSTSGG